ncbi:MAG: hypothetical protein KKE65_05390 [Actinobacteria bacterium]|nr:hypothetical protein [Actinomycetota bacterium]
MSDPTGLCPAEVCGAPSQGGGDYGRNETTKNYGLDYPTTDEVNAAWEAFYTDTAGAAAETLIAADRDYRSDPTRLTTMRSVAVAMHAQASDDCSEDWLCGFFANPTVQGLVAGAAMPAPRVAALGGWLAKARFGRPAANSGRTVAMGRNMADRVIPYAQKNGYDWYKGTPGWVPRGVIEKVSPRALERTDLWFNKRWIKGEMRNGSRIMDIGEPPGYPPSIFYNMERQQVSKYWNYFEDFRP